MWSILSSTNIKALLHLIVSLLYHLYCPDTCDIHLDFSVKSSLKIDPSGQTRSAYTCLICKGLVEDSRMKEIFKCNGSFSRHCAVKLRGVFLVLCATKEEPSVCTPISKILPIMRFSSLAIDFWWNYQGS